MAENKEFMKIAYLTSWHWEGTFVLDALLNSGIRIDYLVVQERWWKKLTIRGYSLRYWIRYFLSSIFGMHNRKYKNLHLIKKRYRLKTYFVKNINYELKLLEELNPDIIIIVGSRIIKNNLIQRFKNKLINFHTGILPNYRGPYSEFWAIYNKDYENVGTTIHYVDEGVDTGPILMKSYLRETCLTPADCHYKNTKQGVQALVKVITAMETSDITPMKQDGTVTHSYSYPEDAQLGELQQRLGMRFSIDFAE